MLDEFVALCSASVKDGQPYVAVMLCHELYRFLYPVEPFADFRQEDPVGFSVQHIRKLIETGKVLRASFTPYAWAPGAIEREAESLEKETSDLYSTLWTGFANEELVNESVELVTRRVPVEVVDKYVKGKRVLDMGCGSGRYSIALHRLGAARVDAIDVQAKSFAASKAWCEAHDANVSFHEGNVHALPFDDCSFEFVFCNGVLHHSSSIEKGVKELRRVVKPEGAAFLYLYAAGGIFWNTRIEMRKIFKAIPLEYTRSVLRMMGMPSKRFIFCDTWYVPVETLTHASELHEMLEQHGFGYEKLFGRNAFDLDHPDLASIPGADAMWGDGEHRYLLWAKPQTQAGG